MDHSIHGDMIRFISMGVKAGKTSMTVYTKALRNDTDTKVAEGEETKIMDDK
ncbi:MAG: hypothetical protein JJE49_05765 [Peptostreptococcaceae bacterium]|nr:hypothetical protein [Peptostreptococcaceae bacterium]